MARQVLVQLLREGLQIPAKIWGGPRHGQVMWKEPDLFDLVRLLHNPTYAGAYVYGQMEYDSFDRSPTNGKARVHPRPLEDWPVCLRDAYPAYITWEQFEANQKMLSENAHMQKRAARKSARGGRALLTGLVRCGRCGRSRWMFRMRGSTGWRARCGRSGPGRSGSGRLVRWRGSGR